MIATIRQAKAKLSQLVASANRGEEVIITSHGKPCAKLVPLGSNGGKRLDMDRIRRIAKGASTGKKGGPDSTQIISDAREDR
jgi:prevent-host-death family protein